MLHEIINWLRTDVLSQPTGVLIALLLLLGTASVLTVMVKERQFQWPSIKTSASALLWLSPILALLAVLGTRLFPFFAPPSVVANSEAAAQFPWEEEAVWKIESVESWGPVEEMDIATVQKKTEHGQTAWRFVLESEQHTTPEDARKELTETVLELATIDLLRDHPEIGNPEISQSLVREKCVVDESLTKTSHQLPDSGRTFETTQIRWVVELDSEVRELVHNMWKTEIVSTRAGLLAGTVGFVTFLFGLLAMFLRVDTRTNGQYRGRLKLGLLCLAIAGGLGFLQVLNIIEMNPMRGFFL